MASRARKQKVTRKKKAVKLTSFGFTTTKPIGRKTRAPKLNFQGFPVSNCVYHRVLDCHCYAPPRYYEIPLTEESIDLSFCHECLLQPCMMAGTSDEVDMIVGRVLDAASMDKSLNVKEAAMRCIRLIHSKIFPSDWGDRVWPPRCIERSLPNFFHDAMATSDMKVKK